MNRRLIRRVAAFALLAIITIGSVACVTTAGVGYGADVHGGWGGTAASIPAATPEARFIPRRRARLPVPGAQSPGRELSPDLGQPFALVRGHGLEVLVAVEDARLQADLGLHLVFAA